MKQLTDYRRWAWNCFRDSQCKQVFPWHTRDADFYHICPSLARYKFDCFSAQGKLDLSRALIEREIEWSDKLLEVIYQDPLCGACDYTCGRIKEMQPGLVIQAMRAQAIRDGMSPPAGFKAFLADLREYLNPYRKYDAERANWLKELPQQADGELQQPAAWQQHQNSALCRVLPLERTRSGEDGAECRCHSPQGRN